MTQLWEIPKAALAAVGSATAMFAVTKLIGHRQLSQLSPADYINGITIGSIAAEMATELEDPVRPLTSIVVYGILVWVISIVLRKWQKARKYMEGRPILIYDGGTLFRENMATAKLDLSEFLCMCRQAGYFCLSDIQTAVFEYNGKMSFLPASASRPVSPSDLDLHPSPASADTEIIMDGRVMSENLRALGLDDGWLYAELRAQGCHSPGEVFLALYNKSGNLSVYKK
jgi:uncharacterized membrane protein YcaP (DUF421 family)